MCRRVTCKTCKRPTWAGCGAHIESVLGDVPLADRCDCRSNPPAAQRAPGSSWLKRLTKRG
jgi:hypothetical protein